MSTPMPGPLTQAAVRALAAEGDWERGREAGRWARANIPAELDARGGEPTIAAVLAKSAAWVAGYIFGAAGGSPARATYTGPTVMAAFSRPKRPFLMHGQRVLVVTRQPLAGTVGVRYDPSDPTHHGCSESTLTTITGVPVADIEEDRS